MELEMDQNIVETIQYNNNTTFYRGDSEGYALYQINDENYLLLKCEHIRYVRWKLNETEIEEDMNIFKHLINTVKLE